MTAVLARDTRRVRALLDEGADPNGRNAAGATSLLWAAEDLDATRLLPEYGADVGARSDDGRTAILAATGRVGAAPIVRLLLDYGANPSDGSAETLPGQHAARGRIVVGAEPRDCHPAVLRERLPARSRSVHLRGRDQLGDDRADDGHHELDASRRDR